MYMVSDTVWERVNVNDETGRTLGVHRTVLAYITGRRTGPWSTEFDVGRTLIT